VIANGPYPPQERWEENSGYSPATMASEIAGLLCAAAIAEANGATSDAATYQATALSWASEVDSLTYTTTGPYGNGDYFLRITPDGDPNSGSSISIANAGGSPDDRTVVDPSFLELVRLGIKSPAATDITNTLSVVDSELDVQPPEGPIWHRYDFGGYGETASGGDYTGSGVGNVWPVLSGERGEYDVADGNLPGAQSLLETMASAANSSYQIPEQDWAGTTGTGGFTFGQPDNSATPLMWSMAQYLRLAIDISAGQDVDTPAVVVSCVQNGSCPVTGSVKETVNVTVPVNTDASGDTVYLDGNYDVLGTGVPSSDDWVATDYPMIQTGPDTWTLTITGVPVAAFQYKFTLGSWSSVEETASCGDVANRTFGLDTADASYTANDTVAAWEGTGGC
jgi:glucoamylase